MQEEEENQEMLKVEQIEPCLAAHAGQDEQKKSSELTEALVKVRSKIPGLTFLPILLVVPAVPLL